MIPPFRARTCEPSTAQSSRSSRLARPKLGQQGGVQSGPHSGLGPIPQPAPCRDSGAAHGLCWHVAPGNASPQYVQHACERYPVRNAQTSGVVKTTLGNGRQQRRDALPQGTRHKISTHPHSPPIKIARRKIADSLKPSIGSASGLVLAGSTYRRCRFRRGLHRCRSRPRRAPRGSSRDSLLVDHQPSCVASRGDRVLATRPRLAVRPPGS